jgi:hypothetical protein
VTNVQTGTKKTVQQTQAVITFSLFSIRVNWPSHQDRFLPSSRGESCDRYPWGDKWNPAMVPVSNRSRNAVNPDDVSAHPQGASPAGVEDLVGNVWQWTDEYTDKHTRAGILRGGSYYKPTGSVWYFPQAYDRISTANIS